MSALVSESTRVSHIKFHGSSPGWLDFVRTCTSPVLFLINSWKKTFCNFCPPGLHLLLHTLLLVNSWNSCLQTSELLSFLSSSEAKGRILIPGLSLKSQDTDSITFAQYSLPQQVYEGRLYIRLAGESNPGKKVLHCVLLCLRACVHTNVWVWEGEGRLTLDHQCELASIPASLCITDKLDCPRSPSTHWAWPLTYLGVHIHGYKHTDDPPFQVPEFPFFKCPGRCKVGREIWEY